MREGRFPPKFNSVETHPGKKECIILILLMKNLNHRKTNWISNVQTYEGNRLKATSQVPRLEFLQHCKAGRDIRSNRDNS